MTDNKESAITHTGEHADIELNRMHKIEDMAEKGASIAIDVAEHVMEDINQKKSTTDIIVSAIYRICACGKPEDS